VKKGAAEIHSDTLTAFYNDQGGGTDVSKLLARGSVVISSPPYVAHGDEGTYDVKTGDALLTGKNLKVESGEQRLTARDSLQYSGTENKMTALGDATAVKQSQTLRADKLTAFFDKGADGNMAAKKIEAAGRVSITTDKEVITGDSGVYDVPSQQAVLTGKVVITQDRNRLEGTRATVDMNTGISQLFADGSPAAPGRVTGIFYPKQKDEKPAP